MSGLFDRVLKKKGTKTFLNLTYTTTIVLFVLEEGTRTQEKVESCDRGKIEVFFCFFFLGKAFWRLYP